MEAFVTISDQEEEPKAELPPLQIEQEEGGATYGKFLMGPLERGFGITLGNPLRRVLMSSIPGAAVTWVRFDGVSHEYSTIPHVKEEVIELLQRVKAIRIRPLSDRPGRMRLDVSGPGDVYAGDIPVPADFEIVNPEFYLATLDSSEARLIAEFNVEHGKGYVPVEHKEGLPIGTLPVDAIFSPVRRVNYTIERTRVGQITDYERLSLEVWTDGTITPMEAVRKAAQILVDQYLLFAQVGIALDGAEASSSATLSIPPDIYNTLIERLDLSSRTRNCLKRDGIHKVGQILERSRADLLKIRNFGEKSLDELISQLQGKGFPVPYGSAEEGEETEDAAPEGLEQVEED